MSILDSVMNLAGSQVAGPIAAKLGEPAENVQRGLQGGAAAMLTGLAAKADQPGFLNQIFGMITNPANNVADAVSSVTTGATAPGSPLGSLGGNFLSTIFGPNLSAVTDKLGAFSGLGAGKMGALLTMAAPLVLGALGQHVRENDMTPSGLAASLKSEAAGLSRFLPAGLGSLFGAPGAMVSHATSATAATAAQVKNKWLWPVVILAALILAAIWFLNRSKAPVQETMENTGNAVSNAVSSLGDFFKTKLPNGVELNIPQNGIENKLIQFLNDSSQQVDDTTWFNFDRLTFDTGKATLQDSSQEQLKNIAEILKAYPNAHVKIGGYTDNTGDASANQKLSQDRADNVMQALEGLGVDSSRMTAEGYGDQHPVADNGTDEGRQQNRRIALRVTQK